MLRFYLGASGAGKSTKLYQEIIERSIKAPEQNFFIIVPDQFTMQTQMDIVKMHPVHGIMNIDVLSFGRLAHRIFDEVGAYQLPVLDDTGKSLILRHVADLHRDELPVIGGNMHRSGYIDEVKSTISELMQYDIRPEQMEPLLAAASKRGALSAKLKDIQLLYEKFSQYIDRKYITTEETLGILCEKLTASKLIRNGVVVLDGFTGFTPVQYRVIRQLLTLCAEVTVTCDIDPESDPYASRMDEQELFFLSRKTIRDLEKIAYEVEAGSPGAQVPDFDRWKAYRDSHGGDVQISEKPVIRLQNNPPMAFLEAHLFRYQPAVYEKAPGDSIQLYEMTTPEEEVRQTCIQISRLIRSDEHIFYRDIAIVCGDLETYSDALELTAEKFRIPIYIDRTTAIRLNPFIEYIKSALNIVAQNYSYESVFHYMRSGLADFEPGDVDRLENYVRALGIRGKKQWEDIFTRQLPGAKQIEDEVQRTEFLAGMNEMRSRLTTQMAVLFAVRNGTVLEQTKALYDFIINGQSQEKLQAYSERFAAAGDRSRAAEYAQIYAKVMDLLNQVVVLLGEEKIRPEEYMDILDAGFGEIEVGTIPQNVDRILVGDIERTRLKEVKYLFFIGVNDSAIPKHTGTGGIISDIDRQFLVEAQSEVELAPTPRQQMYIQRLYLYMNLTKPSAQLYLSFSKTDAAGKSVRPAYLIGKLQKMFPQLKVQYPELKDTQEQMMTVQDSLEYLSGQIRSYADGYLQPEAEREFLTLFGLFQTMGQEQPEIKCQLERLQKAAFLRYQSRPLSKAVSAALYGSYLENSVSRLELFAACCYAHFIRYGLALDERDEYDFDVSDLGNVFHGVLETFTVRLKESGLEWESFTKEQGEEILNQALAEYADSYGNTILMSSARNRYAVEKIHRILTRTVNTLQYQLQKGAFRPDLVEMDFREAGSIDEINIALTTDEKRKITEQMKLHGRIDRVDLSEDDGHVYVKIIDFKSGKKDFNIASLYYGLQLQLVLYMNVAQAMEKSIHQDKEIVPAAILYYHVSDPLITPDPEDTPEQIGEKIRKELRTTGLVNSNEKVLSLLDRDFTDRSDVIPVQRRKDGSFTAASGVITDQDYGLVSSYVNERIRAFGKRILDGDISVNPYEMKGKSACTWCRFKPICGFDPALDGFRTRELDALDEDEVMERLKNHLTPETEAAGRSSEETDGKGEDRT